MRFCASSAVDLIKVSVSVRPVVDLGKVRKVACHVVARYACGRRVFRELLRLAVVVHIAPKRRSVKVAARAREVQIVVFDKQHGACRRSYLLDRAVGAVHAHARVGRADKVYDVGIVEGVVAESVGLAHIARYLGGECTAYLLVGFVAELGLLSRIRRRALHERVVEVVVSEDSAVLRVGRAVEQNAVAHSLYRFGLAVHGYGKVLAAVGTHDFYHRTGLLLDYEVAVGIGEVVLDRADKVYKVLGRVVVYAGIVLVADGEENARRADLVLIGLDGFGLFGVDADADYRAALVDCKVHIAAVFIERVLGGAGVYAARRRV